MTTCLVIQLYDILSQQCRPLDNNRRVAFCSPNWIRIDYDVLAHFTMQLQLIVSYKLESHMAK